MSFKRHREICLLQFGSESKNTQIETFGAAIFLFAVCGCESWYLTLRAEWAEVLGNMIGLLRRIFGPKRRERGVMICALCTILLT